MTEEIKNLEIRSQNFSKFEIINSKLYKVMGNGNIIKTTSYYSIFEEIKKKLIF